MQPSQRKKGENLLKVALTYVVQTERGPFCVSLYLPTYSFEHHAIKWFGEHDCL